MNTGNSAPITYKNPTIAEALCEIHFSSNIDDCTIADLESLASKLKSDYPTFERKEIREIKAEIGPQGVSVKPIGNPVPRLTIKHATRNHLIQISPSVLTINELQLYPGWQLVFRDIESAWLHFFSAIKINEIKRIGLRYINKIPRTSNEPVSEWLGPSEFYPKQILQTNAQFASRFESINELGFRTIVTLAEGLNDQGPKPIIFDIDCIMENLPSTEWREIAKVVNLLHKQIWDIFSPSITPRLAQLLDGD